MELGRDDEPIYLAGASEQNFRFQTLVYESKIWHP